MEQDNTIQTESSYFGYGTLLGLDAMRDYCPSAQALVVARFPGHQLEFRQYSDDPDRSGCHVNAASDVDLYGVVYMLSYEDMEHLDELSGTDKGWFRRIPITVFTEDGDEIETTTYELVNPGAEHVPPVAYRELVRTGAHTAGLPSAYVRYLEKFLDTLDA